MSLPGYAEYKDSGVAWLGQVPSHWETRSLKHIVASPITDGPHETPVFGTEGVPFVSAEAVSTGRIDFGKIRGHISHEDHCRFSLKYKPRLHDIYMVKSGATTGVTAIVETEKEFNIWSPLAAIRCDVAVANPYYVLNFLRSRNFQEAVSLNWSFGTQQNIGMGVLGELSIALPPVHEQAAIAAFLDRETAKIDGLIAEQEKLIALLAEKRQATISHAVTKGVTPNAKMKDSGVAWLGEIPAHWNITRIKYVVDAHDGIQMGPFGGMLLDLDTVDTGFKVYGQENTISGDFSRGSRWVSEVRFKELERYRLKTGDLVLTRKGSLGNARLVQELPQPGICDSDTIRVRVDEQAMRSEFLTTLLHEAEYVAIQLAMAKRGAILSGVNTETIANLSVVAPPPCEQKEILDCLMVRLAEFKSVADSASKAIALLKERRSALIAAAVTGQIDVRGAVPLELAA